MSLGAGQSSEGTNAGGIFVQFNQDCTSLVAGSGSGYHLFALTADDGVEEIYASRSGQDTCLVDRLFSSSLVAIVTVAAPRKLIVCHYKKGTEICNYSYSNTILAVKLNRSRLIVCLEESLHIHNIRDMKILHTIRDTPPNPRGLCALSPCVEHCYVAYPGSSAVGEVQIFDAVHLNAKCVISAHDAPLAALAWAMGGRRLATASERGTVIRVFAVPERTRLHEFRRGVKRCVSISCLAFSACGAFLAATSNTETVHVFRLQEPPAEPAPADDAEPAAAGWMGWLQQAVTAGAGYLPAQVADVLAQGRAFAAARLPTAGARAVAAVTNVARAPRLLVATNAGELYVFALDAVTGGECALLRHHNLLDAAAGSEPAQHHTPPAAAGNSYAGALRGRDPATMTAYPSVSSACAHELEKFWESVRDVLDLAEGNERVIMCGDLNGWVGTKRYSYEAVLGPYGDKRVNEAESERACELGAAAEGSPPRGAFDLRDPKHFPPMRTPAPAAADGDQ